MKQSKAGGINRRQLLKAAAATAAGADALCELAHVQAAEPVVGPILDAYTDQLSYQAGDKVGLHVSTTAKRYAVEVARIGAKRQVVYTKDDLPGAKHTVPADASMNGCGWPADFKLPVAADWPSGYYQVLLRAEDDKGKALEGETFFVVRARRPGKDNRILLQLCTNTYNAYNLFGGFSLYGGPTGAARRVSFDRPYLGFQKADNFTNLYSGYRRWEQLFVEWAEAAGYGLDFAVNSDLEFHPDLLKNYRLVLSVGHDEYWSAPMRDHLEAFIGKGGNVAFFSGNTCFWQVRSEAAGRALASWKMAFPKDPVYQTKDHSLLTGTWSNCLVKRPETQLTGVSFAYGGYHRFFEQKGDGAYTVHRPDHWVFAGTGLKRCDLLGKKNGKLVGYECDGCRFTLDKDGLPVPTRDDGTPDTFEILASTTAGLSKNDSSIDWVSEGLYGLGTKKRVEQPGHAVLGVYTRGGTVFTVGCTEWAKGLHAKEPFVERVTRNVLDRLSRPAEK